MTCHDRDVMNRVVSRIVEIDGGEVKHLRRRLRLLRAPARPRERPREAEYDRQQAMLAKEMRFIERFKAQAAKAARCRAGPRSSTRSRRSSRRAASSSATSSSGSPPQRRRGRQGHGPAQGVRRPHDPRRPEPGGAPRRALGRDGRERRRQDHPAQDDGRRHLQPDAGTAGIGAGVRWVTSRSTRWSSSTADARPRGARAPHAPRPASASCAAWPAPSASTATTSRRRSRALGRREGPPGAAKICFDAPNLLILDEPTNHLDIVTKRMLMRTLAEYEGTIVFVSHDRAFLRAIANRVLELTPRAARLWRQLRRVRHGLGPRGPGHARFLRARRRQAEGFTTGAGSGRRNFGPSVRSRMAATTRAAPMSSVAPGGALSMKSTSR
jgi:hypothetical protein